ncbi:hypothetical protein LIER_06291 [Lithospermum erythrorhizon]|uniref:Reverse transcriptase n=1 Tax=Lithospermum erythrorhizon TaxID=34254 RepID=A0AAV3P7R3_LITER
MCINKACPNGCYPLPNLPNSDQLVDSNVCYKVVDFLDSFRGYHQIFMAEDNVPRTSRLSVFSTQIGRNMEIYVDDMLLKNREAQDHEANLRENFENLRKYNLWLNPINVSSEAPLGSSWGI